MSTFTALNLEPEDDSEDEIDDTKEIQLEESFKLYQNALRLHSQGPQYHGEASEAYIELFRSEVFKYPDVISEFEKDEQETAIPDSALHGDAVPLALVPTDVADNSHNSLPQLVYLAYKNRGQFALDISRRSRDEYDTNEHWEYIPASGEALKNFAEALERDDTDLDLWRKAARVADVLSSHRISRFCLEGVLAGDDPEATEIELSGLDEAFAATEIKNVLKVLEDDLSLIQNSDLQPKETLLKLMKHRLDPYPFLPSRSSEFLYLDERRRPLVFKPTKRRIYPPARTWLSVGQSLLQTLVGAQQNAIELGPGAAISIEMPRGITPEVMDHDFNANGTGLPHQPEAELVESFDAVQSPEKLEECPLAVANTSVQVSAAGKELKEQGEADTVNEEAVGHSEKPPEEEIEQQDAAAVSLPTRKRSSTLAGIDEGAEAGRVKSKRLRARDSNADMLIPEKEVNNNSARLYEDQLQDVTLADQWMFGVFDGLLAKLGLEEVQSLSVDLARVAEGTEQVNDANDGSINQSSPSIATSDLREAFTSWNDDNANAILYGHGSHDYGGGKAGLTLFLDHSKPNVQIQAEHSVSLVDENVDGFVEVNNSSWLNLHQAIFRWVEALLRPSLQGSLADKETRASHVPNTSAYMSTFWSDEIKQTLVQIIVRDDESLYRIMQDRFSVLEERVLKSYTDRKPTLSLNDMGDVEMAQALFELHLDVFSLITNPSSQVDQTTRIQQRDRLDRWANIAGGFVNHYANYSKDLALDDSLVLRFIWASTTYATKEEKVAQEHIMLCLHDLQSLLGRAGNPAIVLPNNRAMPEISVSAVQQEVSRLTTVDFFTNIFDSGSSNPVGIIESLEPVLEPPAKASGERALTINGQDGGEDEESSPEVEADSLVQKLKDFLSAGDASLKLFLWRRLRDAYQAIDYPPRVVSCYLRAIESITEELQSERHTSSEDSDRQISLLKWIKDSDDLVSKLLLKVINDPAAFEYLDEAHLKSSIKALAQLSKTLHEFAVYEDMVRVGQLIPPVLKSASATKTFEKVKDKVREMQVRLWTLQYLLLKEAMAQNKDLFPNAADDLASYLRSVHHTIGHRHYCRYSNKVFLKLMKTELLGMRTDEDYSPDIAQVLFDLHQLKITPGIGDFDHGCTPEPLDKKTAVQMVEVVMVQARRINIKDLIKSELKNTIDKIQQTIGTPKSSPAVSHNKKMINAYLKSPINPGDLYACIKGLGDLATRAVQTETAKIADKGWYFLLGHIALARFKSVKRVNPTPTDDLDMAAAFFRQDLEHGMEKWETWYRLAQVFDAKIEDDLLWTADKINNHRQELATLQRNAIHAYAMAVSTSHRNVEVNTESAQKISEMYTEFASRLYGSSREPLTMEAFKSDLHQKFFSGGVSQQIYKAPQFQGMRPYGVWKLARALLRQSLVHKPKSWMSHYILGKCLWKMFNSRPDEQGRRRIGVDEVLEAFTAAVETLPERKDSRSDYILEPHFKLVSIVHKLVHRSALSPIQGRDALQATPYARKVHLAEDEDGPEWEPYVLDVLKKLGHADKSNWHHRIIARAAHVIYDDQPGVAGALGAKHEFTQQVFTKTMTLQVWKPENERAGRHFVYTSRYVKFFVELLSQINDRTNLDLLVRRIRRKPTEYLNHQDVWEEVVTTYVKMLRRTGKILEGHEKAVFEHLNHDEFTARAEKLEKWAHDPDTTSQILDILRDAIELKKLNNSLMKGSLIDDLIADTYASMYEGFVSQLPPEPRPEPQQPSTYTWNALGDARNLSATALRVEDNRERMSLGNVLMSQTDGAADAHPPRLVMPPAQPIGLGLQSAPTFGGPAMSGMSWSSTPPAPAPAPKPTRVKQITRREVQRKAEGVVVRPPPIKTPILTKKPFAIEIPPPSRDRRGSTSTNLNGEALNDDPDAVAGTRVGELIKDDAGVSSELSSRRGSVHDSADDESELSDIEEQEDENGEGAIGTAKAKPLFPGLMAAAAQDAKAEDEEAEPLSDNDNKMDVDDKPGETAKDVEAKEEDESQTAG